MPLSWNEIRHNAIRFTKEWAGETREEAEDSFRPSDFSMKGSVPRIAYFCSFIYDASNWQRSRPAPFPNERPSNPKVAESLGAEIIRGEHGFKLTRLTGRADLPAAVQAADAAISQGKLMIKYGFALRKHLHQLVG